MTTAVHERPDAGAERAQAHSLTLIIELELALAAQDMTGTGFEEAVRRACAASGATFLFNLPVFERKDTQRVAAVGWREAGEDAPSFAFVSLGADGRSISVGARCDALAHAEPVAEAWFDLLAA